MREMAPVMLIMVVLMAIGAGIVWGPSYLRHRQEARLLATGRPALGRIVTLQDTGNRFNDMPEIEVVMDVKSEDREPWRASFRRVMSLPDGQYFVPGQMVPLRFDPTSPDRVAFAPPPGG